jgi:hypothetical protein
VSDRNPATGLAMTVRPAPSPPSTGGERRGATRRSAPAAEVPPAPAALLPWLAGPDRQPSPVPAAGRDAVLRSMQGAYGNALVQRALAAPEQQAAGPVPLERAVADRSPGSPLDPDVRGDLEDRFGRSLSGVRVHTDPAAAALAGDLDAAAFTRGQDIYFADGGYRPGTEAGRRLLTHEVVHTLQQAGPAGGPARLSHPGDPAEREAESLAASEPAAPEPVAASAPGEVVHRQPVGAEAALTGYESEPEEVPVTGAPPPGRPVGRGPVRLPVPTGVPPLLPPGSPAAPPPTAATEIILPDQKLFRPQELCLDPPIEKSASYPLLSLPIELPPPFFVVVVGLDAKVDFKLEMCLRYGPGILRDIRLALDPASSRYSGTAELSLPMELEADSSLDGSIKGSADWLGLFEVVSATGGLLAKGSGLLVVELTPRASVLYDAGSLTLTLRPDFDAGVFLSFRLDAHVAAKLVGNEVWGRTWKLVDWQYSRAVRVRTMLALDYIHGQLQPPRMDWSVEPIPVDELLAEMAEAIETQTAGPPPSLALLPKWLQDAIATGDPSLVLLALAEADEARKAAVLDDILARLAVRLAVGERLWPTAQRILTKAPSETVPSLDEGTVFIADRHIRLMRYQDALHVVVSALEASNVIDGRLCSVTYVRDTQKDGETTTRYDVDPVTKRRIPAGRSEMLIYDPGFASVSWLFSTIMHEYVHVLQQQREFTKAEFEDPEGTEREEVEAYLWEIEHAVGTGLIASPQRMNDLGERLTDHYEQLSRRSKARYAARYKAAQERVRKASSGQAPVDLSSSYDKARQIVQESSRRIAELVEQRPATDDPDPDQRKEQERIDKEIAAIQRERADALVDVVLTDNPVVEIVDRRRGLYRVGVVDPQGRVTHMYGAISVAWNLRRMSPSAFTLRAQIHARPRPPQIQTRMTLGGTSIQGRVQPFPGDLDFVEEIDITAPSKGKAGAAAASAVIEFVARNQSSREYEFLRMTIFRGAGYEAQGKDPVWSQEAILSARTDPAVRARLAADLAGVAGGNVNTFWRAWVEGGRFIDVTKLLNIRAMSSVTGRELFATRTFSEFQAAYFEEPERIPPTKLGAYAATMREAAKKEFEKENYLKAVKRAYNYFTAIGNLEAMNTAEPLFRTDQGQVNRQVVVIETIERALSPAPTFPTRILRADEARQLLRTAAAEIRWVLPPVGRPGVRPPEEVAADIEELADELREGGDGILLPHEETRRRLKGLKDDVKRIINEGVRDRVVDIFKRYIR